MSSQAAPSGGLVLHLRAPTLEALFTLAAREMYALARASAKRSVVLRRPVEVRGEDHATLLLAWLRELLTYTSNEDRVFYEFAIVSLSPLRLQAQVIGGLREQVERKLHLELGLEIVIRQTPEGYETVIPFSAA